jgi:hypothetical protein
MAGLGVAIFPLPEMSRIVRENRIGIICEKESIRSMADALNHLEAHQIDEFRKNSLSLARTLNGDVEMARLMDIYSTLLSA